MKRYRTPFNLQVVEFAKGRKQFFIDREGGKALIHEGRAADGPLRGLPGGLRASSREFGLGQSKGQ
jgi:hypothetical protein